MGKVLYTIGYEEQDIVTFTNKLKKEGIEYLIDVREQPLSRKAGFSKNSLSQILEKRNIKYVHFKELGSPKDIREKFKADLDSEYFFNQISHYLEGQKDAIEKAYAYLAEGICCLMCFERFHFDCHRKVVAEKIKERDGNGLQIKHI